MKKGLFKYVTALFCLGLEEEIFGALPTPTGTQTIELAWNAVPDSSVEGYNIYYGDVSGIYTTKINVANTNTASVQGLIPGHTYYFSATSYNANNVESPFAAQISYTVPFNLTVSLSAAPGSVTISFPVVPGYNYQLQASTNLKNWSNVLAFPSLLTNSVIDIQAPLNPNAEFYRVITD